MWSHVGAWHGVGGLQFVAAFSGVAIFLLCSGYGLAYSCEKNGLKYFWIKRIKRIVIPCLIVDVAELVINQNYSFFGLKEAFNFDDINWYIKYIFVCYFVMWSVMILSQKLVLQKRQRQILIYVCFAIIFIVDSLFFAHPSMPFLHARQALMFPIGISLFEYKNILKRLENIKLVWIMIFFALGLVLQLIAQLPIIENCTYLISNSLYLAVNTTLAICFFVMSLKCKRIFNNQAFNIIGVISFELFLIHGHLLRSMNTIPEVLFRSSCLFVLAYLFNIINNLYNSRGDTHLNV